MNDLYMDAHLLNQELPEKIYVWVVSKDGEHRIRRWKTKPFDEATHVCESSEHSQHTRTDKAITVEYLESLRADKAATIDSIDKLIKHMGGE